MLYFQIVVKNQSRNIKTLILEYENINKTFRPDDCRYIYFIQQYLH